MDSAGLPDGEHLMNPKGAALSSQMRKASLEAAAGVADIALGTPCWFSRMTPNYVPESIPGFCLALGNTIISQKANHQGISFLPKAPTEEEDRVRMNAEWKELRHITQLVPEHVVGLAQS